MALVRQQGVNQTFSWGGADWRFYEPIGFDPNDPNSHLHLHWLGNGENTAPEIDNLNPGALVKSPSPWSGIVRMQDGRECRVAILFLVSLRSTSAYNSVIDHVIDTLGMPTTGINDWKRYSVSAISGGPERFFNWYIAGPSPKRFLFRKRLILSPTDLSLSRHPEYSAMYNELGQSWCWLWYSEYDTNSGTHPRFAREYWRLCESRKHKLTITYQALHNQPIWNPAFVTTGTSTNMGGSAQTSAWRFFIDPYDGDPNRISFVGDMQLKT